MRESTYLCFEELETKTKTKLFEVCNKISGYVIGHIKWYAPWRKYCFFVNDDLVFDAGCLADILQFINTLMTERKIKKEKKQ
jgi:hypothetical protein